MPRSHVLLGTGYVQREDVSSVWGRRVLAQSGY